MRSGNSILVVDDESTVTDALAMILGEKGYDVKAASTLAEAGSMLAKGSFDLVFTDLKLPDGSGIDLLSKIKGESAQTEVVLMTAHGSLDLTIEAIKRGAYYYIEKPFTPDHVLMLAERAIQFRAMMNENQALRRTLSEECEAFGMIGRTTRMRRIYETIRATAKSDASVLIEGESGTGKELIATAFHLQSGRADRPFITINCAAIPHDLIESELFGHKRGAFTGADRDKRGLIEAASRGTLFLDEIAEMPAHLQTKLLRVLQERKLRRVGDEAEIAVEFRLIAATNQDTSRALCEGRLREDLFFRISTVRIKVPALRERLDDLPLLANAFLRRYSEKYNKPVRSISQQAFVLLSQHTWPGNVRELESVIERAVLFSRGDQIVQEDLPDHIYAGRSGRFRCEIAPFMTMEEIEREAIEQTLERTGGNVKRAAQILNLHRPTLYRKLKKYGMKGAEAAPK